MICFQVRKSNIFQLLRIILNNFLAQSGFTGTLKETKFIYFAHIRSPTGCFSYISIIFAKSVVLAYSNALL